MEGLSIEVTPQARIDLSWSAESVVCLLWALGCISELPRYDENASADLTNKLPSGPSTLLLSDAVLREPALVDRQREIAELWHWRSRTRQLKESGYEFALPGDKTIEEIIKTAAIRAAENGAIPTPIGDDFPAFGKAYRDLTGEEYSQAASIAMERHRAFNWLSGLAPGNRWRDTPTDT